MITDPPADDNNDGQGLLKRALRPHHTWLSGHIADSMATRIALAGDDA